MTRRIRTWQSRSYFKGRRLPKTCRTHVSECDECGHRRKVKEWATWLYPDKVIKYDGFFSTTVKSYGPKMDKYSISKPTVMTAFGAGLRKEPEKP